jgi:hypothetical protein
MNLGEKSPRWTPVSERESNWGFATDGEPCERGISVSIRRERPRASVTSIEGERSSAVSGREAASRSLLGLIVAVVGVEARSAVRIRWYGQRTRKRNEK